MSGQQGSEAPERIAEPALPSRMPTAGAIVAGRYRLLEQVGEDRPRSVTLWRARDTVLERDVGLTVLTGLNARPTLKVAAATAQLEHPGLARVLDVLAADQINLGLTGVVVSEWIAGASVAALSADAVRENRPLPSGVVARALAPVAAAVDAAHRAGLVLGTDHPQRVRIGRDGLARLAFPVVSSTSTQGEDVRGLGALLYLLLAGRWPLPDPPAGLPGVPMTDTGSIVGPRAIRPAVSLALATLAERCVAGGTAGGVYSGAAVYQVLDQVATAEQDTVLIPVVPEHGVDDILQPVSYDSAGDADESSRRRKLAVGLLVLGAATLIVVALVAAQVASFFAGDSGGQAPTLAVDPPARTGTDETGNEGEEPPKQLTEPALPAGVDVYDPHGDGDPDNRGRVNQAIDGDPASAWKTYDYNQPFPALKPGVGLMVSFTEATPLGAVVIQSSSGGSKVEVRTAPSAAVPVEQTELIGSTTLASGQTEITLDRVVQTQFVVIWITDLGVHEGKHATELAEVTFMRAD